MGRTAEVPAAFQQHRCAVTPDLEALPTQTMLEPLIGRRSAEAENFPADETRVTTQVYSSASVNLGPLEGNALRRQPFQRGPWGYVKRLSQMGRGTVASIQFSGRGGREKRVGAGLYLDIDGELVSPDDATRGMK
jgi:hypothetical protein